MNSSVVLIALLSLFILPSCINSRYRVPAHRFADNFIHQNDLSSQEPLREWWKQSNDETLIFLVDKVLSYNYDVAIAQEAIEAARARYNLSAAELLPLITGVGQVAKLALSKALVENDFFRQRFFNFFDVGFDALWEIDIWGRKLHQKKSAYAMVQADVEYLHDTQITLIADVARAYVDVCASNAMRLVIKKQIDLANQKLGLIQSQYEAGLVSRIELVMQEQAVDEIGILYQDVVRAREQSCNKITTFLGSYEEKEKIPLDANTISLVSIEPMVGMPSTLLRRRPDIRAAERQLASNHELVGYAVTEWFPQISLIGGIHSQANNTRAFFKRESIAWIVAPSLSWPLINFGRINARIDEARSNERSAALAYSRVVIQAFSDVEDSLVAYYTYQSQLLKAYMRYRSAQEQCMYYENLFKSGLSSELDFINAWNNMLDRKKEVIGYEQAVATAVISLYKSLGGGW